MKAGWDGENAKQTGIAQRGRNVPPSFTISIVFQRVLTGLAGRQPLQRQPRRRRRRCRWTPLPVRRGNFHVRESIRDPAIRPSRLRSARYGGRTGLRVCHARKVCFGAGGNPRRQQQRIVDVTLRVAQASGAHEKKAPHTSARETGLVVDESVSSARCVLNHCSPSAERRTWGPDIQGQSRADFDAGPALRVVLGDVVDLA